MSNHLLLRAARRHLHFRTVGEGDVTCVLCMESVVTINMLLVPWIAGNREAPETPKCDCGSFNPVWKLWTLAMFAYNYCSSPTIMPLGAKAY